MSGLTLACLMMLSVAGLSIFFSELTKWVAQREKNEKAQQSNHKSA